MRALSATRATETMLGRSRQEHLATPRSRAGVEQQTFDVLAPGSPGLFDEPLAAVAAVAPLPRRSQEPNPALESLAFDFPALLVVGW